MVLRLMGMRHRITTTDVAPLTAPPSGRPSRWEGPFSAFRGQERSVPRPQGGGGGALTSVGGVSQIPDSFGSDPLGHSRSYLVVGQSLLLRLTGRGAENRLAQDVRQLRLSIDRRFSRGRAPSMSPHPTNGTQPPPTGPHTSPPPAQPPPPTTPDQEEPRPRAAPAST